MKTMILISLSVALLACVQPEPDAPTNTTEQAVCTAFPSCPKAGCDFPAGPAPDPTDGAGLWCAGPVPGYPCFCVPQGPGTDTWCMPEDSQLCDCPTPLTCAC